MSKDVNVSIVLPKVDQSIFDQLFADASADGRQGEEIAEYHRNFINLIAEADSSLSEASQRMAMEAAPEFLKSMLETSSGDVFLDTCATVSAAFTSGFNIALFVINEQLKKEKLDKLMNPESADQK